jgi:hypothetical protein
MVVTGLPVRVEKALQSGLETITPCIVPNPAALEGRGVRLSRLVPVFRTVRISHRSHSAPAVGDQSAHPVCRIANITYR